MNEREFKSLIQQGSGRHVLPLLPARNLVIAFKVHFPPWGLAGGGDPQGTLHFKCNDGDVTLLSRACFRHDICHLQH